MARTTLQFARYFMRSVVAPPVRFLLNGTQLLSHGFINIVPGSGVTIAQSDDNLTDTSTFTISSSGGGGSPNLDGGTPSSVYGGVSPINGGTP